MTKSVLIVLTSHDKLGDTGDKTGSWYEEIAAPYYVFKKAGYEITMASTKGGEVPFDQASLSKDFKTSDVEKFLKDTQALQGVEDSLPLSNIDGQFDAIFIPGGHGVVFDLPGNAALKKLLEEHFARGAVISSVCHGAAGLFGAKNANGEPLVSGLKVTGFSNSEEEAVGKTKAVPFLTEDKLKALGGLYEAKADWSEHVVVDKNLITGQNPQSSKQTAQAIVDALK